jgi:hypothetical protein
LWSLLLSCSSYKIKNLAGDAGFAVFVLCRKKCELDIENKGFAKIDIENKELVSIDIEIKGLRSISESLRPCCFHARSPLPSWN